MKLFLLTVAVLFLFSSAYAAFIPLSEAEEIGSGLFAYLSNSTALLRNSEAYYASPQAAMPALYILRYKPRGFVLVAAEEQSQPILGYSIQDEIPGGQVPPHIKWYLDEYCRCIEEIRQHPEWPGETAWNSLRHGDWSAYSPDRDVAPLCASSWDQDWPYNSLCPADAAGPGGHVYAGCVATAMGQVMKKWNHPVTGNGSHTYYATGYGSQSANFGTTTYNWTSMPNSISSVNTPIATLLYHLGIAVDMQYAPDGSGAYAEDAREALVNHFRYNSAAQYLSASDYSATTWASMLRADLDLGRPIFYRGQGSGGHAFVLDGYQGTNYFHFNWGWSGYYNGYFYLSNLNPGGDSFTEYQGAILNLYPVSTTVNDLAAVSVTGSSTLVVNQPSSFNVNISNPGTVAQTSYTVKLMRATGITLASVAGSSIAPGATLSFPLSWTPTSTGAFNLYARVELASDTNSANNESPYFPVSVVSGTNLDPPTNLAATVVGNNNVHLSWTAPNSPPPTSFTDGFETYADFSLSFAPWTLVDVDMAPTYTMEGTTWANAGSAQAYIIFNPSATTPPVTTFTAHSGSKMAACVAGTTPPNNDWLITPLLYVSGGEFKFWARSLTDSYGLERFKVGVSTTGTSPANFTIISGASYVQAPVEWTEYVYSLGAYSGPVYVGIQCMSNDAWILFVDDVMVQPPVSNSMAISGPPSRNHTGYKVYRNGTLIQTINGAGTVAYDDLALSSGTYTYTVTASYTEGESVPAGPASVTIGTTLNPPTNLAAAVAGNDVTLTWTSPEAPPAGNWITWCNDVLGNSIGTNSAAVFSVAHRFTQTDLAPNAGGVISQVKFVPNYADCVYTVKVWTGGSATDAGTLVSSQVVSPIVVGEWNLAILNTPVPIPTTSDVYIGYEANTQGDHPASCDSGPQIEGKGNMIYFNNAWTTLYSLGTSFTYNWLIQTFVQTGAALKAVELTPIAENQAISYNDAPLELETREVTPLRDRALNGFKVYRNGTLINTITSPANTTYTDLDLPNATYVYGVSATYTTGESAPATVNAVVNVGLAPTLFEDGFETYADFALQFAPWTLVDVDLSTTYGMQSITFPGSGEPMAYIVFNPSATTPPLTTIAPHTGAKIAASFAATAPPNNDWLVSPRIHLGTGSTLRFYAKSHTAQYGLERFRVGISTLPTIIPQGFQYITGPDYLEAPENWTEYMYDLSAYDGQAVYIGIRCVSYDAFILFIDDLTVYSNGGHVGEDNQQTIYLAGGWNLVSLNVSPANHAVSSLIAPIASSVQQIKGTEGIYIPNNPYNTLNSFTDGKAYNILMSAVANWAVNGPAIPVSTPLPLSDGWNMTAYLPQGSLPVATATQSIAAWLYQVKGTEGIYIPGNPYSTLTAMYPGKGYWIKLSGAHNLVYPSRGEDTASPLTAENKAGFKPPVQVLPTSMTALLGCASAAEGDVLLARVGNELRGAEQLISPEGIPAALLQIYTETAQETVNFSLLKPDGTEVQLASTLLSEPNASLGCYPDLIFLYPKSSDSGEQTVFLTQFLGVYPNPFNPSTTISFSVEQDNTPVSISIYNLKGQKIRQLCDQPLARGLHSLVWDGRNDQGNSLASGIYYVSLDTPAYHQIKKLVLSK